MNLYDNEEVEIIRDFQMVPIDSICIIPNGEKESSDVVLSVLDEEMWKCWIASTGKGDPPPDFYSDKYGLMMDVMRVDDHGFVSAKGKVVNPTFTKEHEIIKDFERKGLFVTNPDVRLQVLASTDLPTEEDHNSCQPGALAGFLLSCKQSSEQDSLLAAAFHHFLFCTNKYLMVTQNWDTPCFFIPP